MEYSICKDSKVEDTCKRIKKILKNLNIELEELIFSYPKKKKKPSSLSLLLFGRIITTNGKGTNLKNAKASAYSEFMERLQNNYIEILKHNSDKFSYAADEILCDNNCLKIFEKYYETDFLKYLECFISQNYNFNVLPFYNVYEEKISYIPIYLMSYLQGSNGMTAGNTPEEAIVQGLSEIYERYVRRKVILENISMPNIPEEIWSKYERIKELKEYIEQYGYTVHIKDASLGKNIPVVCTIFENKEEGFYGFNFGAQPSLPIAIERTLTEFMQVEYQHLKTIKSII